MPTKRTAQSAAEPAQAASAADDAATAPAKPAKAAKAPAKKAAAAKAAEPAAVEETTPEGDSESEEAAPTNRAERRAKGKGGQSAQPTSRGKVVGGKGPASTQRMWANRRSG